MPHKNIKEFCGLPLIAYTIKVAQDSGIFSNIVVSTDSQEYADIALQYGAEVPFIRPVELAEPHIPSSEVTLHCIRELASQGKEFDDFAVLQPTSPLRKAEDIRKAQLLLREKSADVVISVSKHHPSPLWSNTLDDNLSMKNFISPEVRNKPRQELPTYYFIHGAIFFARTQAYQKNQDPYSMNSVAYIMPVERSVDIDTMRDFYLAELLFKGSQ